jgi:hypothetical protein
LTENHIRVSSDENLVRHFTLRSAVTNPYIKLSKSFQPSAVSCQLSVFSCPGRPRRAGPYRLSWWR